MERYSSLLLRCRNECAAAAREVAADLVYEGFEPLRCQRAAGMVVFCEWYLDRQLEADEQRQRLENDLRLATQPADRLRPALEPDGKAVLQLRGPAPVEPGGDRIGEPLRLRGSGPCGQSPQPIAPTVRQAHLGGD